MAFRCVEQMKIDLFDSPPRQEQKSTARAEGRSLPFSEDEEKGTFCSLLLSPRDVLDLCQTPRTRYEILEDLDPNFTPPESEAESPQKGNKKDFKTPASRAFGRDLTELAKKCPERCVGDDPGAVELRFIVHPVLRVTEMRGVG
jgi:hypothetical protein